MAINKYDIYTYTHINKKHTDSKRRSKTLFSYYIIEENFKESVKIC